MRGRSNVAKPLRARGFLFPPKTKTQQLAERKMLLPQNRENVVEDE
jgi:hypothetical protein